VGLTIALGLAVLASNALAAPSDDEGMRDCSEISAPLGPRPVDRTTVMQTMQKVQNCFSKEAMMQKPPSRYRLMLLLLTLACIGALAIAGLLFWEAKYMRDISMPLAIGVAILAIITANLINDKPSEQETARTHRLEQAKWHWTVRMMRSNQMDQDRNAIEEAIAATNEFVSVAMDGRR
jgi:hypothetical protein